MFAQLGDIVFDGVLGPEAMSISGDESYAEHALINVRPKLDHTGTGLRTISMTIQFHFAFCTPEVNIAALWSHKEQADILSFVLGNGRVIGDFVITSLTETPAQCAPDGTYIAVKANITLKEFFTEAKTTQLQQAAKKAAIALGSSNPIPIRMRNVEWITAMWNVTEKITIVTSIAAAVANVVKYASVPEFWAMFSSQIGVYVGVAINANSDMIDTLLGDSVLTTMCPDLLGNCLELADNLTALASGMPITDYDLLNSLNDDMQQSAKDVHSSALQIFYNVILRK